MKIKKTKAHVFIEYSIIFDDWICSSVKPMLYSMWLLKQLLSRLIQFERDVVMNHDLLLLLSNAILEDDTNVVYHRSLLDLKKKNKKTENFDENLQKILKSQLTFQIDRHLSKKIIRFESIIIPNSKF